MFKNLTVYRVGADSAPDLSAVEEALSRGRFVACGATQPKSMGWVEPRGEAHAPLVESIDGQWVMRLQTEQRVVPGAVVKRRVDEMAREIEQVCYFKMETSGAAGKLRELIALGGEAIEGPWDGEEAITLLADLQAGATGSMTGGGFADGIRPIIEAHRSGDRDRAFALYQRWLPLINHENRQAGFLAAKALMKAGGVIACDAPRAPWPPMHPEVRRQLLDIARLLDPLVLRWGG